MPYNKDDKCKETALRIKAQLAKGELVALPPAPEGLGVVAVLLELRAAEEPLIPGPMLDCLVNACAASSSRTASRSSIVFNLFHPGH